MVIGVKLKPNIRGSNRFERKFLFRNKPFFLIIIFFFEIKITKTNFFFVFLFCFVFLQASSLNIQDADFRPDFRKKIIILHLQA